MSRAALARAPVLAHRVTGDGVPLVLLNGGLMTIASWEPIAAPLERRFRVVRCDFRGQLLSPGVPPGSLDGNADDVARLLDELGIPDAHVAGASYGAEVAMILAARHPTRVRSLAVVTATDRLEAAGHEGARRLREAARAAAAGGDGGRVLDLLVPGTFSAAYQEKKRDALAARRRQVASLPTAYFEGLDGLLAALERLDLRDVLPRISCPTLVLAADGDLTFPTERSRALAAAIHGARLLVVPGSHGLVVEDPARVATALEGFFS